MKVLKPIAIAIIILATSAAFCLACTGVKKEKPEFEKEEGTCVTARIDVEYGYGEDDTQYGGEIRPENIDYETPTKKDYITENRETTREETTERESEAPVTEREETEYYYEPSTVYDAAQVKQSLLEGNWQITLNDGSTVECKFYANGTFSIYDSDGNFVESGYYTLDGYGIYLTDAEGNVLLYLDYNPGSESFGDTPETTKPTAAPAEDLNTYNAQEKLEDAVICYDRCVNTTTFGFETSYADGIYCPHCIESGMSETEGCGYAWIVTNYDSIEDIERYISTYLYGNAREEALLYLEELVRYGFLTEFDGNLYLCPLYNERGYEPLDPDTIRYIGETSDNKHRIEISDSEFTYRLDFVYVDGRYKVCDIIY